MSRTRPHSLDPCLDTVRIALVHKDFTGGPNVSHVGLGISAAYTAKTLRRAGIWSEPWAVKSSAQLRQRIVETNAAADAAGHIRLTHVVLSAPWVPTAELRVIAAEFQELAFVVVSHSSVGFLAADPHAIKLMRETVDLQKATHNVFVGGNSLKFTRWVENSWKVRAVWLPNLYDMSEVFTGYDKQWTGGLIKVGLFGANRPLKNHLSGAAAAVELLERLRVPVQIHMSSGRNEGGNLGAIREMTQDMPGLSLHQTGWLTWPQFRTFVRSMDLVMQVSYTESFNVVSADAIAEGIPVVTSDAIDWVPEWWQAKADEPCDIARVGEMLLRDPNTARHGREALSNYVAIGLEGWKRFLIPRIGL